MLFVTLAALAAAALQPPPPPPPPPPLMPPPLRATVIATPALNAWMDANIKLGSDWSVLARSGKGETLVRVPADTRGTNFTVDLRSERAPSSRPPADGIVSWMTTYKLECHTAVNAPIGYAAIGLHFKAETAAGFSGQNLTGDARPIGLGETLEEPRALFSALCHDHETASWKEAAGPSDLTDPTAVQAWSQKTLDQKGWTSAPSSGGLLFVSDKLANAGGVKSGDVRLEYFEPRFMALGTQGVLIRSVRATVEFDCGAKTARAAGEELFGRRNLKGGRDTAMPKYATSPPPGLTGAHPNFISAPDFPAVILWQDFGAKACA